MAPPVSTLSESTYSAVHLYGAAARQAREDDPGQVTAALQRLRTVVPRGSVQLAGPHQIRQQLHLAEASAGGFRLLNFAHLVSEACSGRAVRLILPACMPACR